MTEAPPPAGAPRAMNRDLRRAWWTLVAYPATTLAAFPISQAVPWLLGYDVATTEAPDWVTLVAFVTALGVLALPLPFTAVFSRRASAAGEPGGKAPLLVGGFIVAATGAIGLFSVVMLLLLE